MAKTIYCAQAFRRVDGSLHGYELHQFATAERALQGGEILAKWAGGVAVFSLTGEADVDVWGDPVLLKAYGDIPGSEGDGPSQGWSAAA